MVRKIFRIQASKEFLSEGVRLRGCRLSILRGKVVYVVYNAESLIHFMYSSLNEYGNLERMILVLTLMFYVVSYD